APLRHRPGAPHQVLRAALRLHQQAPRRGALHRPADRRLVRETGAEAEGVIRMKTIWLTLASLIVSLAAGEAHAQSDYPSKPVRIINDSAAGSANDFTARVLADALGKIWNQQVVTLNQPGAGGAISAKVAAQSPNDGYTLYIPATSPFLAMPGASGVAP